METFADETGQILLKETEHYQLMSFDNGRGYRLRNLDTDNSIVVQGYHAANFRAEFEPYEWPTGSAIDLFFDELWNAYSTTDGTGQVLITETEHYQLVSFDCARGYRLRNLDTDENIVVQGSDAAGFRAKFAAHEGPTGVNADLFLDELWDAYSTGQSTD